jgi:antitoxin component YwqK of YwqJK toxin-antitoxin module
VQSYSQYQGDIRHGYFQSWFVSGMPQLVGRFDLGIPSGTWISFYPTGAISEYGKVLPRQGAEAVLVVRANGFDGWLRRHGAWRQFWSDGQVKARGYYEDGLRSGEWREFTGVGELYSIAEYKAGKLISCKVIGR